MKNPLSAGRLVTAFCSFCGGRLVSVVPPGDSRARSVCTTCGSIRYDNPKLVVGCVPLSESRILLCRRAIEPRYGTWTLPAGFMENGESTAAGAARETMEEAGATVTDLVPFMLIDVPDVHQVHFFFRATLVGEHFECGDESLEVRLFDEGELPWNDLSFPTVIATLREYVRDRAAGQFGFHRHTISRPAPAR